MRFEDIHEAIAHAQANHLNLTKVTDDDGVHYETVAKQETMEIPETEDEHGEAVVYTYSKYQMLKYLIEIGKFNDFNTLIGRDATMKALWDACVAIKSDDDFFLQMKPAIATMLSIGEDELDVILYERCLSDL